jgi:uncharacterized membrane protein
MNPVKKLAKRGFQVAGCGILVFVISAGTGVCGPSTPIGLAVMVAAMLAVLVGTIILVAAAALLFHN